MVSDLQKALKAFDIFRGEITGIFDMFTLTVYAAGKEKMRNNYSAFAGATDYNNGTFLKNSRLVSATIVDHVDIE